MRLRNIVFALVVPLLFSCDEEASTLERIGDFAFSEVSVQDSGGRSATVSYYMQTPTNASMYRVGLAISLVYSENPKDWEKAFFADEVKFGGMKLYQYDTGPLYAGKEYWFIPFILEGYNLSFSTFSFGKAFQYKVPDFKDMSGMISGHKAVDLGLSVRWAEVNLGAEKETDEGTAVIWGETSASGGTQKTQYGNGGKTVLDPCDDAATVDFGKGWRMPTRDEVTELARMCEWTPVYDSTSRYICGYNISSRVCDNSIYLPIPMQTMIRYWTSCTVAGSERVYGFDVLADGVNFIGRERSLKNLVRAVAE